MLGIGGKGNLIERLCRQSGRWRIRDHHGELYHVEATDGRQLTRIGLRFTERSASVPFQSFLPVQFPLDKTPSGLFARLMMRSFDLTYAAWVMHLEGACEAVVLVSARLPISSLDVSMFNAVCGEIREEICDFERELKEKFSYGVGGMVAPRPPAPAPSAAGIRFLDDKLPGNGLASIRPGGRSY